jgi:hypothetical protein
VDHNIATAATTTAAAATTTTTLFACVRTATSLYSRLAPRHHEDDTPCAAFRGARHQRCSDAPHSSGCCADNC